MNIPLLSPPTGWLKEEIEAYQFAFEIVEEQRTHLFLDDQERLQIKHTQLGSLCLDISSPNYNKRILLGKNELISRAVGLSSKKGLRVFDSTCGLGEDAVFLAQLGAEVTSMEREPLIYLLLKSAQRGAQGRLQRGSWQILFGNSLKQGEKFYQAFDAMYFDPMFPEKKKTALPRKEMQIFQAVVGHQDLSSDDLAVLKEISVARLVIKRPLKAQPLFMPVTHQFLGKTIRFDMYSQKRLL